MNSMMDYEQWMWDEGEQELFSSFPLLDQKASAGIQDGVEISDLITPAGNLLDQLDAMYPTDKELFPEWMSEKMSFLEEIEELSSEAAAEPPPALLPLEKFTLEEEEKDEEKSQLTDLDILNQLVAYSATDIETLQVPPEVTTQGDALPVTELSEVDRELWEALSAASGLSSPAASDDMSFLSGSPAPSDDASFLSASPAPSEDMDVFTAGSPTAVEHVTILAPSVVICAPTNCVSLSPVQSKPIETVPPKSKARPVLKTARGTVKPSRKERKKDQNKQAATRYREKKRSQTVAAKGELDGLEKRNVELKDTVESMTKEIKYLKDLLQEVLTVKGQLKQMGHTKE